MLGYGKAVVHGDTAYFACGYGMYSYVLAENKWTNLPQIPYEYRSLAIVKDTLTSVGGGDDMGFF